MSFKVISIRPNGSMIEQRHSEDPDAAAADLGQLAAVLLPGEIVRLIGADGGVVVALECVESQNRD